MKAISLVAPLSALDSISKGNLDLAKKDIDLLRTLPSKSLIEEYFYYYTLGIFLFSNGRYPDAIKVLDGAIKLKGIEPEKESVKIYAVVAKAWIQFVSSKKNDSYDTIRKQRLNGKTADLLDDRYKSKLDGLSSFMIGYILNDFRNEVAENREEALNLIKASISKFKSPLPQYVTGHIYHESNQRNPALKHFESLVQQYPDFPEGHNDIAVILAENKDYAKSTEQVMTAIRLKPSLAEAQKNLVKLVTAEQKSNENFWEFWGSSTARKVTALALLAVAAAPFVASFVIIPVFDSSATDAQNQDVTEDTILSHLNPLPLITCPSIVV